MRGEATPLPSRKREGQRGSPRGVGLKFAQDRPTPASPAARPPLPQAGGEK